MGLLLIIITALATGLQKEAVAQSRACPPYSKPIKLNFETKNIPTRYRNDLNVTGIHSVMRQRGQAISGKHSRTLGLTSSQLGFSLTGRTTANPVSGGYCVYVESVNAEFAYREMDVYIASEFRPNTCEYKVIMDHENQHVAINRNALREYAPLIRQELERQLSLLQPRFTANAQISSDRKMQDLHEKLDPLMDEMERVMSRQNSALDTDSNYTAISEMCKNWDQGNVWPVVNPPAKK
jgi:hypothetical protein